MVLGHERAIRERASRERAHCERAAKESQMFVITKNFFLIFVDENVIKILQNSIKISHTPH